MTSLRREEYPPPCIPPHKGEGEGRGRGKAACIVPGITTKYKFLGLNLTQLVEDRTVTSPALRQTGIQLALCGVVPMAIVAFYSVHDTFAGNSFLWVGRDWYQKVLTSPEFFGALGRSLGFSLLVLLIQIPLGIYIALRMPPSGLAVIALHRPDGHSAAHADRSWSAICGKC